MTGHPSLFYFGALFACFAAVWGLGFTLLGGLASGLFGALFLLLLALPASEVALELVHGFVVSGLRPRLLPRFAFKEGVPESARTLVAVPALLENEVVVDRLLEDLEVRSLANTDKNLHFALLTDFVDAETAETAADAGLLERAERGIAELNARHGGSPRFLLFQRRRVEAPSEGRFMGVGPQTRQTGGAESAAARRRRHHLRADRCRAGVLALDPLRDHARRRHRVAA